MRIVYKIATVWMWLFDGISIALLMAAAVGMAFVPGAEPDPHVYPAKFTILALAALVLALPGWLLSMALMDRAQ